MLYLLGLHAIMSHIYLLTITIVWLCFRSSGWYMWMFWNADDNLFIFPFFFLSILMISASVWQIVNARLHSLFHTSLCTSIECLHSLSKLKHVHIISILRGNETENWIQQNQKHHSHIVLFKHCNVIVVINKILCWRLTKYIYRYWLLNINLCVIFIDSPLKYAYL